MKKIEGNKINLRRINIKDADSIAKNITKEIPRYMERMPWPYHKKDAVEFIRRSQKNMRAGTTYQMGIENKETGEIIGMIGLNDINKDYKRAEIGYWLGKKYWGKGFVTEAVELMIKLAFKRLKLRRLYARVYAPNKASAKVLEKAGFKREGRLRKHIFINGRYCDELIYGLLK